MLWSAKVPAPVLKRPDVEAATLVSAARIIKVLPSAMSITPGEVTELLVMMRAVSKDSVMRSTPGFGASARPAKPVPMVTVPFWTVSPRLASAETLTMPPLILRPLKLLLPPRTSVPSPVLVRARPAKLLAAVWVTVRPVPTTMAEPVDWRTVRSLVIVRSWFSTPSAPPLSMTCEAAGKAEAPPRLSRPALTWVKPV